MLLDQSKMSKGESRRLATIICGHEKSPGKQASAEAGARRRNAPAQRRRRRSCLGKGGTARGGGGAWNRNLSQVYLLTLSRAQNEHSLTFWK